MNRKIIYAFILVLLLSGCATWQTVNGMPVSKADKFDCDQKCGLYDLRQSGIAYGMCSGNCLEAKGYVFK